MNTFLTKLAAGHTLSQEEAEAAMELIMQGNAEPEEIAAFLMGLRTRGETLDELTGFTRIMRQFAIPVQLADPDAIDLCGTGGDKSGTFNISTTASFVCAGAGVTVAKHGNRSVSSKCGSADVLKELGVQIELGKEGVEYCLNNARIAFLFAPFFHPAMKYVMPVRRKLGVRTFFNILGPLCNPAGVRRQLVGAFSLDVARQMASILSRLGAEHIVTAHAEGGLDEISISGATSLFRFDKNGPAQPVEEKTTPEVFGIPRSSLDHLQGSSAEENAVLLKGVLEGRQGPHRDVVLLNAAYALFTSGIFPTIKDAFKAGIASIDDGKALEALNTLIAVSQQAPTANPS